MCWRTKELNNSFLKIAQEDIKVFKVMTRLKGGTILSIYQEFKYETGVTYNTVLNYPRLDLLEWFIYNGFHSYSLKEVSIHKIYTETCDEAYIDIRHKTDRHRNDWFHIESWFNIENKGTLVKVECTIPKGSRYFLNEWGEYVSDNIRVDNIIEEFK